MMFMKAWLPIFVIITLSGCSEKRSATSEKSESNAATPTSWVYQTQFDKMRGTKSWVALVTSANQAEMDFPYQGGSPAHIELWQTEREAPDNQQPVLVLEKGQFDCHECNLSIKFDNGPILQSRGTRSDCGDSQCINLNVSEDTDKMGTNAYVGFHKRLLASKRLTIEAPLYHFGNFQYEFSTAGLIWPQPDAPTKDVGSAAIEKPAR